MEKVNVEMISYADAGALSSFLKEKSKAVSYTHLRAHET